MAESPNAIWRCANCGFSFERFKHGDSDIALCFCASAGEKSEWIVYAQAEPMLQQLALWMPPSGQLREQMWWFLRHSTGSDDGVRALVERARATATAEMQERFEKAFGL